jgi:hypothetical protein
MASVLTAFLLGFLHMPEVVHSDTVFELQLMPKVATAAGCVEAAEIAVRTHVASP